MSQSSSATALHLLPCFNPSLAPRRYAGRRHRSGQPGAIALLVSMLLLLASSAQAEIKTCVIPNCPEGGGEAPPGGGDEPLGSVMGARYLPVRSDAGFRPDFANGSPLAQRVQRQAAPQGTGAPSTQSLFGELAGDWDYVTGFVTFPYLAEGTTSDQLLLRGFPAERRNGDLYEVKGWQRNAYWIDAGDGIPRLLASELIVPGYVPAPDDPFVDSGELNFAQLVLYREAGRDYSDYPGGGAFATIWFLADAETGDVIDAIVDLYDAQSQYEKTEYLFTGDSIKPLLVSYRLSEPEFLYFAEYGDFIPLTDQVSIGLANHVPGVDYMDPFLDSIGFSADRPLELLLEGYLDIGNGDASRAYSAVYPLGYTWPEARVRVFENGFEGLTADPGPPGRIVRMRP